MAERGWDKLDVILVTGDAYIDSPFIGTAVVGRILEAAGYRVGILSQPVTEDDFRKLGEPRLYWGVSAGSVDSMVANYTASKKRRKSDDYTPGGENVKRPDRATIAYTNAIRRYFKETAPILLGGIEASLRRIAHYDFWSNRVRRSVLFDAKADYLLYGMGETSVLAFTKAIETGSSMEEIRGLCRIEKEVPADGLPLPSFEAVEKDKQAFHEMFRIFYANNDPVTAKRLIQKHGDRYLVQNPPVFPATTEILDRVHGLPYTREVHPEDAKGGRVKALDTIRFSVTTHQGCYGECNFCAIAIHQGRTVHGRSAASILDEVREFTHHPEFKGILSDVGGPTANMYGFECKKKLSKGACPDRRCLYPEVCPALRPDHGPQVSLLRTIRQMDGIRKVFVASGIRHDLIDADRKQGDTYLKEVVCHHVSGQMKIAPEHTETRVLDFMGKPGTETLERFKKRFEKLSKEAGKPQFLTYYFIAAHPGCTEADMKALSRYATTTLKLAPEQVQIFTPTPSTWSTTMYWTELDMEGRPLFVEKDLAAKERQKTRLTGKNRPGKGRGKAASGPSSPRRTGRPGRSGNADTRKKRPPRKR